MAARDEVYRITDARLASSINRNFRTRRYLISMAIRTGCFIAAVFVEGWPRWALMLAAVVLPYLSVVMANEPFERQTEDPLPPLIIKDTS